MMTSTVLVSTFESLPNEILIIIFEQYTNGLDLIAAFWNKQNNRIDSIIESCKNLKFNFLNCKKEDFSLCISLLPSYVDKIKELFLSGRNTPSLINTFLYYYSSLSSFQSLKKLYFDFDAKSTDIFTLQTFFYSLSNTNVHTLQIKIVNAIRSIGLENIISNIFHLVKIEQFRLNIDCSSIRWNLIVIHPSNIRYLTIVNMICHFQYLQFIFHNLRNLKYLNIQFTECSSIDNLFETNSIINNIDSIENLETLLLTFQKNDVTTFDMLTYYLKRMSNLRRLHLRANKSFLNADLWQQFLQTTLFSLTDFRIQTTLSCIRNDEMYQILDSFETAFWRRKTNFYFIITQHKYSGYDKFGLNHSQDISKIEFDEPVVRWWIVPLRSRTDSVPVNKIISFGLYGTNKNLSEYYKFNKVKQLTVFDLNDSLYMWLEEHINPLKIQYLNVSAIDVCQCNLLPRLFLLTKNCNSLRIQYNCLMEYKDEFLTRLCNVTYADISIHMHSFNEEDISVLSKLFPNIEYLVIKTEELTSVKSIKKYLPNIRSLTFKTSDHTRNLFDSIASSVDGLFSRQSRRSSIIFWIDDAGLNDPFWQRCNVEQNAFNTTSKDFKWFSN